LRQVSEKLTHSVQLFTPAPVYRVKRDTNSDTPLPPDEPMAENPPDGAILDYFLPSAAKEAKLEILDAQNRIIRRFTSSDKPEITYEQLQKQLIPLYWVKPWSAISSAAGMHRWVWDLRYPAPLAMRHEYPIAAIPHDTPRYPLGPTVLPGSYTVRLTVDGKPLIAPLTIKMDPRVKTSVAGLQKKFQAETRLASLISDSSRHTLEGASMHEQLQKEHAPASVTAGIQAFDKKLTDLLGKPGGSFAPPSPEVTMNRLNSEASALYQQVWQADAEPTTSQIEALTATEHEAADLEKRWKDFTDTELPDLNRLLHDAKAPEIHPQIDSRHEDPQMDEE
jgi:hypothetical protein